jgi:proteasome lid subunit RPN8/RPN11/molybdopterin converting factor small subunit
MPAPAVRVRLPAVFRAAAGGRAEVRVEGATVGEALAALCRAHPELTARLLGPDGGPRRYVSVFVNDEDARQLGGVGAALADGDELTIVPAISGGAASAPAGEASEAGEGATAQPALAAVAALAERSPGAEVCGFVLAGGGAPAELVPVPNAAPEPARAFAMRPQDVLRVLRRADDEGRTVAAIWHSHVTGGACLSPADVAGLTVEGGPMIPDAELWIAGVEQGRAVEVRGYRWTGSGWTEGFRRRGPFTPRERHGLIPIS